MESPSRVTLASVLRLTEGNGWEAAAQGEPGDPFEEVWQRISRHTREVLEKTTLKDMEERTVAMAADHPREYVI